MPCNVDVATQEILKLSEEADPDGTRTMGVLTKPDLASEKATQDAIMDLVFGKRNPLRLGYYIVKNRSADDHTSTISDRCAQFKTSDSDSRPQRDILRHLLEERAQASIGYSVGG